MTTQALISSLPRTSYLRRFFSAVALSLLFLILYGLANQLTEVMGTARIIRFKWEELIPFMPLMIVPYMSIDLFFVSSFFLAQSKDELNQHSLRIALTIIFSCLCFLAMPLRCSFTPPETLGIIGWVFERFLAMDKPYNQFPSLHVALCVLLTDFYCTKTRGIVRTVMIGWFFFIAASTLLTYQHHFIDLIGGSLVGAFFMFLLPLPERAMIVPRYRFSLIYGLASTFLFMTASIIGGLGYLLFWPAVSLLLVSISYLRSSTSLFPKFVPHFRMVSTLLFYPVILGHKLSYMYYAHVYPNRTAAWDALTSHVWIGRVLSNSEAQEALRLGVGAIVDLAGEMSQNPHFRHLPTLTLPILDLTAPKQDDIVRAIHFIEEHCRTSIVYIHCKVGYSRTAAVAACWLLHTKRAYDAKDAIEQLRAVRSGIIIRPEVEHMIGSWH